MLCRVNAEELQFISRLGVVTFFFLITSGDVGSV